MDTNITKEMLETLFRHSTDAVCAVCIGRVIYANPAAEKLFGKKVTGESSAQVFPELEFDPHGSMYVTSLRLHGQEHPVTVQPEDGLHLVLIQPVLKERPAVPDPVLREMRTAVFSLRISLERLLQQNLRNSGPYGDAAIHSYYSLLRQIRQLSTLSDLQSDQLLLRMEPLDLTSLLEELLGSVRTLLGDRPVELLFSLPDDSVRVQGDPERLRDMVLALLLNSLQHTPAGGRIVVELKTRGRQALLTVSDNGEGMDSDQLRTLFAPTDDGLRSTGAGLGLAVVQGLARMHGGAAAVESRKKKGTRVCVTLPISSDYLLRDNVPYEVPGADALLIGLAPILGNDAYGQRFRD